MDLNADLAEGSGPEGWQADAALLEIVTSANIACGGHAGDEQTMRRACAAAIERGVAIGAHPGYADRENFGRVELDLPIAQIITQVEQQLALLSRIASEEGGRVTHVKPHGALYHRGNADPSLAAALAALLAEADSSLAVLIAPGAALLAAAKACGLATAAEGFADRAYGADGLLVPRTEAGSLLAAPAAVAQALSLATSASVTATDGTVVAVAADSICIHGDSAGALQLAGAIRSALLGSEVRLERFA